jgi:GTP-binding protein
MGGLIDTMLEDIPAPSVHWYVDKREDVNGDDDYVACEKGAENFNDQPFSMTATTVGYDPYLGRTCTRRVYSGRAMIGDGITLLHRRLTDNKADGTSTTPTAAAATTTAATTTATLGPSSQVTGIFANRGVSRAPLDPPLAIAGDIVTLPGVPDSTRVGDTLTSTGRMVPAAPAASTTPRRHP